MTTPRSRLRVIRANAQALQRSIGHLGGSDVEFNARFASEQVLWDENAAEIEADLAALHTQLEDGLVKADIEDDVEAVKNAWIEAREGFKTFRAAPGDQDARTTALAAIDDRLHAMVFKIGMLTIPQRVTEYLAQMHTGEVFHFHRAFEDELPLEADRLAVLQQVAGSEAALYGVVDVNRGLIWAVSRNRWRRWRGYIGAAVVVLAGVVVAYFAHDLAAFVGMTAAFADRSSLVAAYVLIVVGVVLHIGLDVYKRARSDDTDSPAVLDDLFLWGHIHELQVITTAFGVWIGTAILAGLENPITVWSALVTGYSLDSVLDAGIRRFDSTASAAAKGLTDKLAEAPAIA